MYRSATGVIRWNSVTAELYSSKLPLAQWFRAKLPNTEEVFRAFRRTVVKPCLEPPPDVPGGTAGAAFDMLTRCRLGATVTSNSVVEAIYDYCPSRAWAEVAEELVAWVDALVTYEAHRDVVTAPDEGLLRGCWAIALFVELVRGVRFERSALGLLGDEPTCSGVLDLMPASAVEDLRCLERSFVDQLLPVMRSREGDLYTGPAFSMVLPGDADLIKGTTLIEVKAMVHRRKRDGTPRYSVDSRTIYQVVAYALLAQELFSVEEVIIFNARYAHVYCWPLTHLLTELGGTEIKAHDLAAELMAFLEDPIGARVPPAARHAALSIIERGDTRHL